MAIPDVDPYPWGSPVARSAVSRTSRAAERETERGVGDPEALRSFAEVENEASRAAGRLVEMLQRSAIARRRAGRTGKFLSRHVIPLFFRTPPLVQRTSQSAISSDRGTGLFIFILASLPYQGR